jgi:hypothetical protein
MNVLDSNSKFMKTTSVQITKNPSVSSALKCAAPVNNKIMPWWNPLKSSTQLPIVEFDYPDSTTNHMKTRYVRVIEANADYIKGNELGDPNSTLPGKFKQYSKNRIARNGVHLVSF